MTNYEVHDGVERARILECGMTEYQALRYYTERLRQGYDSLRIVRVSNGLPVIVRMERGSEKPKEI